MTDKQKRFVDSYILSQNGSKAAREAGYPAKSAPVTAYRLLRNPAVKAAIKEQTSSAKNLVRQAKANANNALTVSRLLTELGHIAYADPADFFENGKIKAIEEMPESARRAITGFKEGKFGPELRFDKKIEALTLFAKHLGVLQEQPQAAGGIAISINMTLSPAAEPTSIETTATPLITDSDTSGQD